eukprot:45704-Rhodomonas_salina.1
MIARNLNLSRCYHDSTSGSDRVEEPDESLRRWLEASASSDAQVTLRRQVAPSTTHWASASSQCEVTVFARHHIVRQKMTPERLRAL